MKIHILPDPHFDHANMLKYENRPADFNEVIIKNCNKLIKPDDVLIVLGDVIMGQDADKKLAGFMYRIPGKKILCLGNHDVEKKWGTDMGFMERGFDFVCSYYIYGDLAFSHAPLTPLPLQTLGNHGKEVRLNIHGHFHRGQHRGNATINKAAREDKYYNYEYFDKHREKYRLVQIEDELRPFTLQEILEGGEK